MQQSAEPPKYIYKLIIISFFYCYLFILLYNFFEVGVNFWNVPISIINAWLKIGSANAVLGTSTSSKYSSTCTSTLLLKVLEYLK